MGIKLHNSPIIMYFFSQFEPDHGKKFTTANLNNEKQMVG
jgi:hypothetical protein